MQGEASSPCRKSKYTKQIFISVQPNMMTGKESSACQESEGPDQKAMKLCNINMNTRVNNLSIFICIYLYFYTFSNNKKTQGRPLLDPRTIFSAAAVFRSVHRNLIMFLCICASANCLVPIQFLNKEKLINVNFILRKRMNLQGG